MRIEGEEDTHQNSINLSEYLDKAYDRFDPARKYDDEDFEDEDKSL